MTTPIDTTRLRALLDERVAARATLTKAESALESATKTAITAGDLEVVAQAGGHHHRGMLERTTTYMAYQTAWTDRLNAEVNLGHAVRRQSEQLTEATVRALLDEVERLRARVAPAVEGEPEPRKVVIWHHREDDEELPGGDDVDEAIYNAIHAAAWGMCGELKRPDMLEETITVYGFARMAPTVLAWRYLEQALEDLDEEHSDGSATKPTPAMIEAADAFASAIEREYVSWACEVVEKRVVNVREWCAAHRPEWLAQLPASEPEEGGDHG